MTIKRIVNNLRYAFWRKLSEKAELEMDKYPDIAKDTEWKKYIKWAKLDLIAMKKRVDIDIS